MVRVDESRFPNVSDKLNKTKTIFSNKLVFAKTRVCIQMVHNDDDDDKN